MTGQLLISIISFCIGNNDYMGNAEAVIDIPNYNIAGQLSAPGKMIGD